MSDVEISPGKLVKWGAIILGGLLMICALFGSFYTVDQKNADVVTFCGKYENVSGPGFHFKIPFFETVTSYSTATQQVDIERNVVNTSDNQKATITLLVQYDIPPEGIKIISSKYPDYEKRIYSLSSDVMKRVFGKYNVMDIPSMRGDIEAAIMTELSTEAKRLYGANITEVQIKDVGYSDAFEESIDRMTKAKADVEQAKQAKFQAKIDAERLVEQAQGTANAAKAQAEGQAASTEAIAKAEADSIRMKGEAEAASIKAQTEALNASPQFVNFTVAKQWDGKLPASIGVGASSSSIPMLKLDSIK